MAMHALVKEEGRAREIFDAVCKRHEKLNREMARDPGCGQILVDLLRVEEGFECDNGATLFWGSGEPGFTIVATNNGIYNDEDADPDLDAELTRLKLELRAMHQKTWDARRALTAPDA